MIRGSAECQSVHEGYFKIRAYKNGPWIPVRVWLEDGDRCQETGELVSDQIYKAEENRNPNDPLAFNQIDPFDDECIYRREITKKEFQWLVLMKTIY